MVWKHVTSLSPTSTLYNEAHVPWLGDEINLTKLVSYGLVLHVERPLPYSLNWKSCGLFSIHSYPYYQLRSSMASSFRPFEHDLKVSFKNIKKHELWEPIGSPISTRILELRILE